MGQVETAGTFTHKDAIFEVNKERAVVFAGGRALLMQLAHPMVADAIQKSGFLETNPQQRLLNTLDAGLRMIFCNESEVEEIAKRINAVHSAVCGQLSESVGIYSKGQKYEATDPKLLKWVGVTIAQSSLNGYELLVGNLSPEQKVQYLQNAARVFEKLGLNQDLFPKTEEEMARYVNYMINTGQVVVSPTAKKLAPYALLAHQEPTKTILKPFHKLTIGMLPEKLRHQYGFSWSELDNAVLEVGSKLIRRGVSTLPNTAKHSILSRNPA